MNFVTKLIVAALTISATIIGSIWTGYEKLDSRMDEKVKEGESRVLTLVGSMKQTRDAEIVGIKNQFTSEIGGLKDRLVSMDNKLNVLLRRTTENTIPEEDDEELYSNYKERKKEESKSF